MKNTIKSNRFKCYNSKKHIKKRNKYGITDKVRQGIYKKNLNMTQEGDIQELIEKNCLRGF
jgi:hypothetical protein